MFRKWNSDNLWPSPLLESQSALFRPKQTGGSKALQRRFINFFKYPVVGHNCGTKRARTPGASTIPTVWNVKSFSYYIWESFISLSVRLTSSFSHYVSLMWFFPLNHKLIKHRSEGCLCFCEVALTPVCCQAETMRQSLSFPHWRSMCSAYLPFPRLIYLCVRNTEESWLPSRLAYINLHYYYNIISFSDSVMILHPSASLSSQTHICLKS